MQFNSFLEAAPDAVVIVDHDGRIVRVNGQTEKMFGYGREELLGQQVEILLPERLRGVHRIQREGFVASPSTRPMGLSKELRGRRRDGGEFPVEISLSPIPSTEGIRVASIIRDVTDRKRMERELRDADRRKDEFLATLGHELRNPLAPIRNAVHILGMQGLKEAAARTAREVIVRQVAVMARLIDDLLDASRINSNKLDIHKRRIDLAEVLERAVKSSGPLIQQCGHELTVCPPPRPVLLDADPVRLRRSSRTC